MTVRDPLAADTAELLRDILTEIRALRADLAGRSPRPDAGAAKLVLCISRAVGARVFSVTELLEHAQVTPELRTALIAAVGAENGRKVGKLLRRIEGMAFDGCRIMRAGSDREGILWLCDFETRKPVSPESHSRQHQA
jgi:hypothetical protein